MRIGKSILAAGLVTAIAFFAAPSASLPEAEMYAIDPAHSSVLFRINHLGVSNVYGRFNGIAGDFTLADGGTGSVSVTIDAKTVDTANEKRDNHLKSPDFFSVDEFPQITFKSDALKLTGGNLYEAKGTLALHGTSKEVTVVVERIGTKDTRAGYRTGFEGTVTIRRSDFGMTYGLDGALGDEVKLILAIEGVRQ
jgi:polyisoprenoid-binding protein YceI